VHGLKHLEEIGESWLCARRTLGILHLVTKRWSIELPEEAEKTFMRAEAKFGPFKDHESSPKLETQLPPPTPMQPLPPPSTQHQIQSNFNHNVNPVNGDPTNGFFPPSSAPLASPMPTPNIPQLDGSLSLPPHSADELNKSNPHNFAIPQAHQQDFFNSNYNQNRTSQAPPTQPTTSPSMLFGGVDSLIQEQGWWLRDSHQLFANWNGMEHDTVPSGNSGFDMGIVPGNMGYGNGNSNGAYGNGITGLNGNGINGNGNRDGNVGFTR
jgi:hypothetical protein